MNNKAYNCYGEQRMGYKYYKQSVIDFNIHSNNKLTKEIKRFRELCDKTEEYNKNEEINLSLDNFSKFLEIISNEYDKDIACENFYWGIFTKFIERVKNIYKSKEPQTIDINTIKFSYIIKGLYIKNKQIKYYNQIKYFINNEEIEWEKEDRETFKQYIKDNFEEYDKINKDKKENQKNFSIKREEIINYKINYKDDVYEQTKKFYYLCEEIQKLNNEEGNLSLNNIYDIVNIMNDGYYYGKSINNIRIIKFYYNMINEFIKRIQYLYKQTKTYKNITIDTDTVNFSIIIKKVSNDRGKLKYKNQIIKFVEECDKCDGWKEEDKKEIIEWVNSFN